MDAKASSAMISELTLLPKSRKLAPLKPDHEQTSEHSPEGDAGSLEGHRTDPDADHHDDEGEPQRSVRCESGRTAPDGPGDTLERTRQVAGWI